MQSKNNPKPIPKREPTLKELMAAKKQNAQPRQPDRKEPTLKEQVAKTQQAPPPPKKTEWQTKREERIKTIVESDPQQTAELLRKLFLDKK